MQKKNPSESNKENINNMNNIELNINNIDSNQNSNMNNIIFKKIKEISRQKHYENWTKQLIEKIRKEIEEKKRDKRVFVDLSKEYEEDKEW